MMENVAETVCRSMYAKLSASPIPRYMPIPPFRFLDDSEMPIVVSMNDANDDAIRLWYSTSYCAIFFEPRSICLEIYSFSCGDVKVSCCPFEKTRSIGSICISVSRSTPLVIISRIPFIFLIFQFCAFQWYFVSAIVSYCIDEAVMCDTSRLFSNLSRQNPKPCFRMLS